MHPTANIIAKFGAIIGMDGLETENGVCTLRFDDVTVTLECAENDDALYLYSRVCGLPESDADKLALYGLLLELDSFFKGTDGGVLGIEPLLDAVTYTRRLPLEELPDTPVFDDPAQRELYDAVLALPQAYRIVLYLFYYEDMPTKEIAAVLHISQNAVTTRLTRAREALRRAYQED